jgi:hypothetical protein
LPRLRTESLNNKGPTVFIPAPSRRRHLRPVAALESSLLSLLPIVLMFVVLYFIVIRLR